MYFIYYLIDHRNKNNIEGAGEAVDSRAEWGSILEVRCSKRDCMSPGLRKGRIRLRQSGVGKLIKPREGKVGASVGHTRAGVSAAKTRH